MLLVVGDRINVHNLWCYTAMAHIDAEKVFRAEFDKLKWQPLSIEIAAAASFPSVVCVMIAQYATNASAEAMSRIVEKAQLEISLKKHDHLIDSIWYLQVLATETPFCILTQTQNDEWLTSDIVRKLFMAEFGEFGQVAIEKNTFAQT
jgi:ketopantoate reductase